MVDLKLQLTSSAIITGRTMSDPNKRIQIMGIARVIITLVAIISTIFIHATFIPDARAESSS